MKCEIAMKLENVEAYSTVVGWFDALETHD